MDQTRLSGISTPEGPLTYSYSGSNLVSVADPLNRVTKYDYNTGFNSWLVSSISYPTAAYTNYTYARALVGTEAKTYYVTSQNIYVSSGSMTKSTSFSYLILNGQVQYCNSTVSSNSTNQSSINSVFSSPGKSTEVDQDGGNPR